PVQRFADLGRLFALNLAQRADARVAAVFELDVRALAGAPAERPRKRQAADRPVNDLEDIERRVADPEAADGGQRGRRLVANGFEQYPDAPRADRRPEQHRDTKIVARFAGEVLEHLLARRRLVHQQLLEQLVIMVGELFEHLRASLDLSIVELGRNFDPLRLLPGAILEGIFKGEVDKSADLLTIPDRDLPGDQR